MLCMRPGQKFAQGLICISNISKEAAKSVSLADDKFVHILQDAMAKIIFTREDMMF